VTPKHEWFYDADFWEQYSPIMFDLKHWDEVSVVADGVTHLAGLKLYGAELGGAGYAAGGVKEGVHGPRVADLCCGFGRVSLELARRGFSVTGVDITKSFLDAGKDDAAYENLSLEFIQEDVRSFKRPAFFDLAVNLYISFGYFEDPGEDLLFAKNVYESLKPGASFIIETLGKEIAVRNFVEAEWFERAGFMVLTEYEPVDSWSSLKNRWILIHNKDGRRIEKTFIQRLYAASELRKLLFKAGFSAVELYGNWDESPYDNSAETLIAVGRKLPGGL
jgi:SAM-dependent methyltransferase